MAKKRILLLNRRDIKNPFSGGAEEYTHEIFSRMTDEYDIVYISHMFKGAAKAEYIDGIKYIRKGSEMSVHFHGLLYYLKNRKYFDMVIDHFNGIGFMTFLSKKSKVVIFQLYDEFWIAEMGRKGHIFRLIERIMLRLYRKKHFITISESSKSDCIRMGIPENNIDIVYCGLHYSEYLSKKSFPKTVAYLGRLRKTKNPEGAIKAFLKAKATIPDLNMIVMGDGPDRERLVDLYGGRDDIKFTGFISDEERNEYLRQASLLLVPSIREGWGLVVIQAAMTGTPSVAFNIAGLRDSVVDGETGILVDAGDSEKMAQTVVDIFNDDELLRKYSENCLRRAKEFSWGAASDNMRKLLKLD